MKKIILFTAIWCPSCLIMRPRYQALVTAFDYRLEEVDFDDNSHLVKAYNIGKTLPVAIIIDDQLQEIKRIIGEVSPKKLQELLKQ